MRKGLASLWALLFTSFVAHKAYASELGDLYGGAADEEAGRANATEVAPQVILSLRLTLKPQVSVTKSRILLADLAECHGREEICDELDSIDLGASPEPGRMRVVLRRDVQDAVAKETNHQVTCEGPESVRVSADFRDIDAATIREAIQSRLAKINSRLPEVEVTLKQVVPLRPLKIRPGEFEIGIPEWDAILAEASEETSTITDDWAAATLSSIMRLQVEVRLEAGERIETVPVRAHFAALRSYPVAKHALERGATIHVSDFRLERKAITNRSRLWVSDVQNLEGRTLRLPLGMGDVPSENMLHTPFLVKRGETVDVAIKTDGVSLRGRGKTMNAGALGDAVEVMYLATKKRLKGRVTGPSQVEVAF